MWGVVVEKNKICERGRQKKLKICGGWSALEPWSFISDDPWGEYIKFILHKIENKKITKNILFLLCIWFEID